jgi:glycerol-3-phosphate acyltransferase PlsX
VLIGLNGVVVKSHGGTDPLGFAHAVDVGHGHGDAPFNERIRVGLGRLAQAAVRVLPRGLRGTGDDFPPRAP